MPHLPAVAHQVRSSAVPTPQRILMGGHPGFAGATVPIDDQIYGMILPRQGHPRPRAVAGASVADAIRLNATRTFPTKNRRRRRSKTRAMAPGCWVKGKYKVPCPDAAIAGKSNADAVRLASGTGVAGGNKPPSYPDYPGNPRRAHARARRARAMAGSMFPPSYPDYPGNQTRRDAGRGLAGADAVRHGYAGHGHHHGHGHGHCCDSCAHGGPCEGCDGRGGCGKPNCGCL